MAGIQRHETDAGMLWSDLLNRHLFFHGHMLAMSYGYVIPLWRLLVMGERNIAFHYRIDESRWMKIYSTGWLSNGFEWINSARHHIFYQKNGRFFAATAMISATLTAESGLRAARLRVPHSFSRRDGGWFSGGRLKQRFGRVEWLFFGRTPYFGQSFFWSHYLVAHPT